MNAHGSAPSDLEWTSATERIDWCELSALYRIAPLGDKDPRDLETVFKNSRYCFFVFRTGQLVGAGRGLADGADCSYLCDVAVHPDYQGLGLGKMIVQKLVDASWGHKKILLYTLPGREGFYKKLGFKRMSTAMAIFADQNAALHDGLVDET